MKIYIIKFSFNDRNKRFPKQMFQNIHTTKLEDLIKCKIFLLTI